MDKDKSYYLAIDAVSLACDFLYWENVLSYRKSFESFPGNQNDINEYHNKYLKIEESFTGLFNSDYKKDLEKLYIEEKETHGRFIERILKNVEDIFPEKEPAYIEEFKQHIRDKTWEEGLRDQTIRKAKSYLKQGKNPVSPDDLSNMVFYCLDYFHEDLLFYIDEIDKELMKKSKLYGSSKSTEKSLNDNSLHTNRALKPKEKKTIVLIMAGKRYCEIAAEFNETEYAVKKRVSKIRRDFRLTVYDDLSSLIN